MPATSPMSSSAVMSLDAIRAASRLVESGALHAKVLGPFLRALHRYKIGFCKTGAILSARRHFTSMGRN